MSQQFEDQIRYTLNDLTNDLEKLFDDQQWNVVSVLNLLKKYKSNPSDWNNYCLFDDKRYTRNLVYEKFESFNILILCWSELQYSQIHNHPGSQCFVKILSGKINESRYFNPDKSIKRSYTPLELSNQSTFDIDQVTYINDDIGLHKMGNPSVRNKSVTLHIYVPPYKSCKLYDENTSSTTDIDVRYDNCYKYLQL